MKNFLKNTKYKDIFACLLTVFTTLFAVAGAFAGKVNPEQAPMWIFAGLLLPATVFTSLLLVIYWALRKKLLFLIPLASIILNYNPILSNFQIRIQGKYKLYSDEEILKVLSYNIHEFQYGKMQTSTGYISGFVEEEKADIVCFQEFDVNGQLHMGELAGFFDFLPYSAVAESDENQIGMAIFSKYPVLRWQKINFENTGNGIMWADIKVSDSKTIRVVNAHLQTTSLNRWGNLSFWGKIQKMKSNAAFRAQQARKIIDITDTTLTPVIICGDFNDTPSSFTYSSIRQKKFTDGFQEAGSGIGGTFRGFAGLGKFVRIDYILHSRDFRSIRYKSPNLEWSDHKPVISELVYQN